MSIAVLIAWVIAAVGGFYLLAIWLARGGVRQQQVALLGFTMFGIGGS